MPADRSPSLLHNSGYHPHMSISYTGLAPLKTKRTPDAPADNTSTPSLAAFSLCRFILFPRLKTEHDLYAALNIPNNASAARTLMARINDFARTIPIPGACILLPKTQLKVVTPSAQLSADAETRSELLLVLSVLSKVSEHVWLRTKYPSVGRALTLRDATLVIPMAYHEPLRAFSV
jgi:hypothetical protein